MTKETRRIQSILEVAAKHSIVSEAGISAIVGLQELDDCAVMPLNSKKDIVIGTDFIRGTGFYLFKKKIMDWKDIGYYLIGANVSDIAAMGAIPVGVVIVCRYTQSMKNSEFNSVIKGIMEACKKFKMPLLGGDTGSHDRCILSATAIGVCKKKHALLRSNARANDVLCITGKVGLAGAALAYFSHIDSIRNRLSIEKEERLARSWKRITPALKESQFLSNKRLSRCAIDTSDGLLVSCEQLAAASSLSLTLSLDRIAIDPLVFEVSKYLNTNPLEIAIGESVDFRLLFATSQDNYKTLKRSFKNRRWQMYKIGYFFKEKHKPRVLIEYNGKPLKVKGKIWSKTDFNCT